HRNILLGTVCFAAAVVTMHFTAISLTDFVATGEASVSGPALSNEALALGVTVAVFLICGGFVLTGISFIEPQAQTDPAMEERVAEDKREGATAPILPGVPYEREGQTFFAPRERIAAVRAEGHYTILYMDGEKLFCPWSITEAEARLKPSGFLRAHRSYLINPAHVTRFERARDNGLCHFERTPGLERVPVSRSRLPLVREALGV
ncbi:MAG: carbon monoxide dehydrogenase, partial [Alphaproteobacteria bacterium]